MTKILVIQNKRIGDVLISSVIAENIKKVFPQSEITYFVYDYTVGVLEGNPYIDHIIAVDEKKLKKFSVLLKTVFDIRKSSYDIIFDPYAKFQSRMICLFSGAEFRIGLKRAHKSLKLPFYTHPIDFLEQRSHVCGKAIEDKVHMITSVFPLKEVSYIPQLYLTPEEKKYAKVDHLPRPIVMLGVLGSVPKKSLPKEYIANLVNFITANYRATILFNYAPNQKEAAQAIYELCDTKENIQLEIYENSIRGFIKLMNQCDLLVANEGGSVHITKALSKPTFTIYSPYINKESWCSFEDGTTHESIHLLDEKPELFNSFTQEETRKIEDNPEFLYRQLMPELILKKLKPFLDHHLTSKAR
ncbi:MAG: ADP-heptose--LPS heptosyltransferase [Flavobacteriaceae bacterium]|nr:ADP-heptose--LPS heptosyltransferase [Flavobacteriaceae bacterium]